MAVAAASTGRLHTAARLLEEARLASQGHERFGNNGSSNEARELELNK